MEIATAISADGGVITLTGRFDGTTVDSVRAAVEELTSHGNTIVFDLGEVTYVDAQAVAFLVETLMRCRDRGGEVGLSEVSPAVDLVLRLAKLRTAFGSAPVVGQPV